ncbi:hypothetical protein BASA81_010261 [Batrachochytrium salamandrivorans]|nr:hypothetical protein BASA81_010261 [Batrachochytrium salamandrivorans]
MHANDLHSSSAPPPPPPPPHQPLELCQSPMLMLAIKTIESPCIDSGSTPSRRQLFDVPASTLNTALVDSPPSRAQTSSTSIFPPYSAGKLNLETVESAIEQQQPQQPRMELLMQVAEDSGKQKKKRQAPNPEKKSAYRGVSWQKTSKAWVGQYKSSGKTTYLGLFAHEQEAAKAYDLAVFVKGASATNASAAAPAPANNQFNFGIPTEHEVAKFKANNHIPEGRLGASMSKRADMDRRMDMRLARQSSSIATTSLPPTVETTLPVSIAFPTVVVQPLAPVAAAVTLVSDPDEEEDEGEDDGEEEEGEDDEGGGQQIPPPPPPRSFPSKPSLPTIAGGVSSAVSLGRTSDAAKCERGATSHYRGVSWYAARQIWKASIQVNRKKEYIGRFNTEEEAARAYNQRATELRGNEAILNLVPDTETRYPNGEEPDPALLLAETVKPPRRSSSSAGATAAKRKEEEACAAPITTVVPKRLKPTTDSLPPLPVPLPTASMFGTPRATKPTAQHINDAFSSATLDDDYLFFASPVPNSALPQIPASMLGMPRSSRPLSSSNHHNLHHSHHPSFTPLMVIDSPASSNKVVPFPFTPSGMDSTKVRKMAPFT